MNNTENTIELIKASAGSGKTYTLTERLTKSTERIRPAALLVTTFTQKAAAELQDRIRKKFLQENKVREANEAIDAMIGTVNSIFSTMLRDYSIMAGLSPVLDVIPENQMDTVFRLAVATEMEKRASTIQKLARRLSLEPGDDSNSSSSWYNRPDWQGYVKRIVESARSNGITGTGLRLCADRCAQELTQVFDGTGECTIESMITTFEPWFTMSNEEIQLLSVTSQKYLYNTVIPFYRYRTWANALKFAKAEWTQKDIKGQTKILPPDLIEAQDSLQNDIIHSRALLQDLQDMTRFLFDTAANCLARYEAYKSEHGLIDFVDQETKSLRLLKDNTEFQTQIVDTIEQFMVDEFQDTSPIQLALFSEVHKLLKDKPGSKTVWVGDLKQAIYGFRGTDPDLMKEVDKRISDRNPADTNKVLSYSWRSKQNLVKFANILFTQIFDGMFAREEVQLQTPPERPDLNENGTISVWLLPVGNRNSFNPCRAALARQIARMIHDGTRPGDIAVLCRSGSDCTKTAQALKSLDIQASAESDDLLCQPECRLALAAYEYVLNPQENSLAAAEFAILSGNTLENVLKELLDSKAQSDKNQTKSLEAQRLMAAKVAALSPLKGIKAVQNETPLELLNRVILELGLDEQIDRMSFPASRRSNLDALRAAANEYIESVHLQKLPATLAGFPAWLAKSNQKTGTDQGDNIVQVMTYHGAKGLEWPIVILTSLDASSKATPFKACGVSIGETDVDDPLKNRAVHCWPWPFAKQTKIMEQMNLDHHPIVLSELEEEKRLFYVGLTRAKNQIVFALPVAGGDVKYKVPAESNESQQRENVHAESENAPPAKSKKTKTAKPKMIEKTKRQYTPKCNLLDRVSPGLFHWPNLDNWPMQDKEPVKKIIVPGWNIANSDEPFELEMLLLQESDPLGFDRELPGVCVDPLPKDVPFERYPAYLSPSLAEKQTGKATLIDRWEVMAQDGRLVWDDDVYARFGNAFHEFVAMGPEGESSSAEQILAHWNIDKAFAPGFKTAVDRFYEHVKSKWPGGQIMTEMPITLLTEHGRRYQGYIDFLIETDDGFVIIDHKTHKSNSDDEFGLYASGQKAQLQIYRQAVQKATGKNVFETIIHFPLGSRMYRVETDD